MPDFIHKELAEGPWFTKSLADQLANVGTEVERAARYQDNNKEDFTNAFFRALDLFDLTLEDPRWKGRRFEIARARELFCDAAIGANQYHTSLKDLEEYFLPFAIEANMQR